MNQLLKLMARFLLYYCESSVIGGWVGGILSVDFHLLSWHNCEGTPSIMGALNTAGHNKLTLHVSNHIMDHTMVMSNIQDLLHYRNISFRPANILNASDFHMNP